MHHLVESDQSDDKFDQYVRRSEHEKMHAPPSSIYVVIILAPFRMCYLHMRPTFIDKMSETRYAEDGDIVFRMPSSNGAC